MMTPHEQLGDWSGWAWPLIANHLWQATLLSLLAFAAAAGLRRAPARARYAMWLLASARFLLPPLLLAHIAAGLGLDAYLSIGSTADTAGSTFYQISYILSAEADAASGPASGHNEIFCAMTAIWFLGFAAFFGWWIKSRAQFSRSLRRAHLIGRGREAQSLSRVKTWLGIKREIGLIISPKVVEPGVWRIWKPVVVLPERIGDELSDAELEAVMMHEVIHVSRWDNLVSLLHAMLCFLFWFHPVVWILERKLLTERERVCDEKVIELCGASDAYASSLLKVFRFSLGLKIAGVSCATGANLRRRVEQIMESNNDRRLAVSHRLLVAGIVAAVILLTVAAGIVSRETAIAQGEGRAKDRGRGSIDGVAGGVPGGVAGGVPGGVEGGVAGGVESGVMGAAADGISEQALTNYQEELEAAPEIALNFINKDDAPLTIMDARIKAVKHSGQKRGREKVHSGDSYLVQPSIKLLNNTGQRITELAILFASKDSRHRAYTERKGLKIEPHSAYTFAAKRQDLISLPGEPEAFTVSIAGVGFQDGTVWGKLLPPPPPPPPPPAEPARPADPPPPEEADGTPRRTADGLAVIKRVPPSYPQTAKEARAEGTVTVAITVNEEGRVVSAEAESGHPLLRDAAVEAARQWEFHPTVIDGRPVKVRGKVTFNFTLTL